MNKRIAVLIIAIAMLIASVSPAYAGGDKVRGDEGTGSVHQHQVTPPWWSQ